MIWETETIQIFDDQGTLIVEYPWPKPGTKYVGSGNSRGRRPRTLTVTDVLTHEVSPMS